jgi:beta-phosphoglucomutase-like phosphatase (HAD superfamily)
MPAPFRRCTIEAIIFDLDGALLDSAAQIAAAINVLFRGRGLETFDEGEIVQPCRLGVTPPNRTGVPRRGAPFCRTSRLSRRKNSISLTMRRLRNAISCSSRVRLI